MDPPYNPTLPAGYVLHVGYPPVPDYLHLRSISGLTPKKESQAQKIATGSWYGCYITCTKDNSVVGMGRIIGDGGWYFHIADMAVHPDHQRKSLGDHVLKTLVARIISEAPDDGMPYISLLADAPGIKLYRNNGFVESAPASLGMVMPPEYVQSLKAAR